MVEREEMIARIDDLNRRANDNRADDANLTVELATEAIQLAEQLGDQTRASVAHRHLISGMMRQGKYAQALNKANEALMVCTELHDDPGRIDCLNLIGSIHARLGNLEESFQFLRSAQDLARELGDRDAEARALANMIIVFIRLTDFERASQVAEEAVQLFEGEVSSRRLGFILNNAAEVRRQWAEHLTSSGEHERASDQLERALAISRRLESLKERGLPSRLVARNRARTAAILDAMGRHQEARLVFEECIRLARRINDPGLEADVLFNLGQSMLRCGDPGSAVVQFNLAKRLYEQLGQRGDEARTHHWLSDAHRACGDLEAALDHYKEFHRIDSEVRSETAEQRAQLLVAQLKLDRAQDEAQALRLRSMELARINQQLRDLAAALDDQAKRDALTGLANRRTLEAYLQDACHRAAEHHQPISLVMLDVDHFKLINDQISHVVGDRVLVTLTQVIGQHLRATDLAARFGGDEFAVVLPGANAEKARLVSERMRLGIEAFRWSDIHPDLVVTISLGVSDDQASKDPESILGSADAALLAAKAAGRNRVVIDTQSVAG